jgi:drug/metabolite transporter (DMT)-like permease
MCLGLVSLCCLDATAKWINRTGDPLFTVWARYIGSVLLTLAFVNPATTPGVLKTKRPGVQALRSLVLFVSTSLGFFALQHLPLVENTAIVFSTPLIVALLAGPLLGEWAGPHRLAAIGVGFVGILVVTRPGLGNLHPAAFLALGSAVCYALYAILTRMLAAHDSSATTLVYSGFAGVILMTPLLPWIWSTPVSGTAWVLLFATGVFGTLGHWLLILAHRRAPAPTLSPFMYSQIIWTLSFGYILFGDWPDQWTFLGVGIIVASGLYLLYRERVRHVDPGTSP